MYRVASVLALLGMLTDAHPLSAAPWSSLPSLPEARSGAAAVSAGGRVYVLGGQTSAPIALATFWDGTAWSETAPMDMLRAWPGAATVNGAPFVTGGIDVEGIATPTAELLFGSGFWLQTAPMPGGRYLHSSATIGDVAYVAGGRNESGQPAAECFAYDAATNSWSTLAPMAQARYGAAAAVLEGRLWVMGGATAFPVATVERFDPASGSWSSAPPLPEPLWLASASVVGGRVWIAGGMNEAGVTRDRVFSAGADGIWRSEDALPQAVSGASMASLGDCLVMAGGVGADGANTAAAAGMCWTDEPPPPPPAETLSVAVRLTPGSVNGKTQGNWISAQIDLGFPAADVVLTSLTLDGVPVDLAGSSSASGEALTVKFPRAPFSAREPGVYELPLVGRRTDDRVLRGFARLEVTGSGALARLRPSHGRSGVVVTLEQPEDVVLDVIDLQGRVVSHLAAGPMASGSNVREWPRGGEKVARGSYFVRLRRTGGVEVVRLAVLR